MIFFFFFTKAITRLCWSNMHVKMFQNVYQIQISLEMYNLSLNGVNTCQVKKKSGIFTIYPTIFSTLCINVVIWLHYFAIPKCPLKWSAFSFKTANKYRRLKKIIKKTHQNVFVTQIYRPAWCLFCSIFECKTIGKCSNVRIMIMNHISSFFF